MHVIPVSRVASLPKSIGINTQDNITRREQYANVNGRFLYPQ